MTRIVEILVAASALGGIATFLGFRAAIRRTLKEARQHLGRRPPVPPQSVDLERRE